MIKFYVNYIDFRGYTIAFNDNSTNINSRDYYFTFKATNPERFVLAKDIVEETDTTSVSDYELYESVSKLMMIEDGGIVSDEGNFTSIRCGTIDVTGEGNFTSIVSDEGNFTSIRCGTIDVTGNATFVGGTIDVTGDATFESIDSNIITAKAINVDSNTIRTFVTGIDMDRETDISYAEIKDQYTIINQEIANNLISGDMIDRKKKMVLNEFQLQAGSTVFKISDTLESIKFYTKAGDAFAVIEEEDRTINKAEINGDLYVNGASISSDRRIKDNIESVDASALFENILQMKPKYYTLKDKPHAEKKELGFIAQEVDETYTNKRTRAIPSIQRLLEVVMIDEEVVILKTESTSNFKDNTLYEFRTTENKTFNAKVSIISNIKLLIHTKELEKEETHLYCYGEVVDDFHSINYNKIVVALTASVHELKKENNELRERLEKLEALIQR
jgi:hypothetical protein